MAKKRDRIDVLTVKLTVHIPIDSGQSKSVENAAKQAEALLEDARKSGDATMTTAYGRVGAPVPVVERGARDEQRVEDVPQRSLA